MPFLTFVHLFISPVRSCHVYLCYLSLSHLFLSVAPLLTFAHHFISPLRSSHQQNLETFLYFFTVKDAARILEFPFFFTPFLICLHLFLPFHSFSLPQKARTPWGRGGSRAWSMTTARWCLRWCLPTCLTRSAAPLTCLLCSRRRK